MTEHDENATGKALKPGRFPRGKDTRAVTLGDFGAGTNFLLAFAMLVALVTFDLATKSSVVITGMYAVTPFLTALRGAVRATVVLGLIAVAAAAISGVWNDNAGTLDYDARLLLVAVAAVIARYAATTTARNNAVARQLELLNQIAAVAEDATPGDVLATIGRVAVPELADICLVDVVADGQIKRVAASVGPPRTAELEPALLAREPTIPDDVVQGAPSTAPHLNSTVEDSDLVRMSHSPEDLKLLRSLGVRSFVSVPLISRGRRIGAMTLIQAWSGRRQGEEDAQFARVLGGRAALVLDNSGLLSDLDSVERRMDVVMEVLDEAVVVSDRGGELIFANRAAIELFGCATLEELIQRGHSNELTFRVYEESGRSLDEFASSRLPWAEIDDPSVLRILGADGQDRWVRLRSRSVDDANGKRLFSVHVLGDVTELKLEERANAVRARVSELLLDESRRAEILAGLASTAVPGLADVCAVLVPGDEEEFECVSFAHVDPGRGQRIEALLREQPLRIDEEGLREFLDHGEPFTFGDLSRPIALDSIGETRRESLADLGVGSMMVIPLRAAGKLIGAMVLANHTDRIPLSASERIVGKRIGERIALSVENARVVAERNEIGRTLQEGLQSPPVPEIPGWAFAATYRPAGVENHVGGDFYDFFRIEDGWMAVIGDVTGHGARAATVTALARYTLRTAGAMTGNPTESLRELNRALLARPGGALCTAILLAMRTSQPGRLEIAVAGHPAPLISRRTTVEPLECAGPMLGAFETATWETREVTLAVGEGIVLYTDGVTEARRGDGRFGLARVVATADKCREPETLVTRLDSEVFEFSSALTDDAAVVAGLRSR